jgi:cellobiose phosphorylase
VKYGHFDEKSSEYVVTRPDTPTPWINYIGEGDFGGIVTNTGGGYSFDKDPRNKRILRYRYNNIPMDRPGRYVYIRDAKTKEYCYSDSAKFFCCGDLCQSCSRHRYSSQYRRNHLPQYN